MSALKILGIVSERHIRVATGSALAGSVVSHGFSRDLAVISDDEGQFMSFFTVCVGCMPNETFTKSFR